jgi:hypothetical protein
MSGKWDMSDRVPHASVREWAFEPGLDPADYGVT